VHTYPESHPEGGLCTFRADIEVSTCVLRGKSFDITGKRRNLTGIRGITGFTLFGYLIPVKEKLSRSAKLLILLLKSLHWSKGGVQNQFYHTSK